MKLKLYGGILFLLSIIISNYGLSQDLYQKLSELQLNISFTFEPLQPVDFFNEKYVIHFEQPVDHKGIESVTFTQRIYLSHLGFDNPVVFITEGYDANYAQQPNDVNELSRILNANQICVEHRYFGESIPDNGEWKYLTVFNAASDHHRIVEFLKQVYSGKWVSTGISKGGQTAMLHRLYYPDDVTATVGYVCPLNFSIEDKRVYHFLENAGLPEIRKQIFDFQYEMLQNKNKYLPAFQKLSESRSLTYPMGLLKGYELTVLEYSFAFWQWGSSSVSVTPSDPEKMVDQLDKVANIDWVSNEGIARIVPFFYQALTEMGFYGYDISPFRDVISFESNPVFDFTAPDGMKLSFDPVPMQQLDFYIRHKADKMLFIYGEWDTWTATAVEITYNNNVLKVIKPQGSHFTRINNLPEDQKAFVIKTLTEWLE